MEILKVKNLEFAYKGEKNSIFSELSFSVNKGEFVVVCGESGTGKTTLLKLLKKELKPNGETRGDIVFSKEMQPWDIGFVMQDPDNQIVTDKVWHELAFGLENMGLGTASIRRRIAEICGFFGIGEWYHKKTVDLSGGQKQLLNLASIMAMNPSVLLLDEPTSQLDPVGASEFLATLKKINQEFGTTIIIVEHRLEEIFSYASKVLYIDNANKHEYDKPKDLALSLKNRDKVPNITDALPTPIKIWMALRDFEIENFNDMPMKISDANQYIKNNFGQQQISLEKERHLSNQNIFEIKEGFFRYERNCEDVLKNLNLEIKSGEFYTIVGANGVGKTTTLKILSGIKRLYRGKYRFAGKKIKEYSQNELYRNNIAFLPQNPKLLFVKDTVKKDLLEGAKVLDVPKNKWKYEVDQMIQKMDLFNLESKHPYDLSGGEKQKVALAKILISKPKILLLDEPTKGLDAFAKNELGKLLVELNQSGMTIVAVSHDIEFAAKYSTRCGMFFDGTIVSEGSPEEFFAENKFYTTSASRISRDYYDNVVTSDDLIEICKINQLKK